jgi:hypothetical protein
MFPLSHPIGYSPYLKREPLQFTPVRQIGNADNASDSLLARLLPMRVEGIQRCVASNLTHDPVPITSNRW